MMIIIGAAFLVFASLVHFAHFTVPVVAMLVGLGLVIAGLITGERINR